MKNLILVSIYLCVSSFFSQTHNVDSLRRELLDTDIEKDKIEILISIIKQEIPNRHYNDLFNKIDTLLSLSTRLKDTNGLIRGFQFKGKLKSEIGNVPEGINYINKGIDLCEKTGSNLQGAYMKLELVNFVKNETINELKEVLLEALSTFEEKKDSTGIILANLKIGYLYQISGKLDSAYMFYYSSLRYSEISGNLKFQANNHIYIGNINNELGNIEKAINHSFKAIRIGKEIGDELIVAQSQYFIGGIYYSEKKIDSALLYFNKSILLYEKLNYKPMLASVYEAIGGCNFMMKNYDSALYYFKKSLFLFENLKDEGGISVVCISMGELYLEKKEYKFSEEYLKKALRLLTKNEIMLYQDRLYLALSTLYASLNNYKKAHFYHKEYIIIKDSLLEKERIELINELETKYETEKKDKEIKELSLKNQLTETQKNAQKIKAQFYLWGGIGSLLIFSLGGFIFYQQRKNRFKNEQDKLEQKLLQTQLNPHFMSNFLMAIQTSIYKDSPEVSSKNVSKFGRLNRKVLEASRNDYILLEDEIDFLKNYMDLQLVLTPNKFEYNIELSKDIDESEISIPPMLIQPFIENSIEHGFVNFENKGEINIKFRIEETNLIIDISDNGLGRNISDIKKGNFKQTSHATQITKERIELFKRKWNQNITFNIRDLATGTSILFEIPLNVS